MPSKHTVAWYRKQAKERFHKEGELEVDDRAVVSKGEDDGAYVQAWVWVSDNNGDPTEVLRLQRMRRLWR